MNNITSLALSVATLGLATFSLSSVSTPIVEANAKPIFPLPECRIVLLQPDTNGDTLPDPTGVWRGVWGYWNQNNFTVDNTVQPGIQAGGVNNYFKLYNGNVNYDAAQANAGQVSVFLPGRYFSVFAVDYPQHETMIWALRYPTTLRVSGTNSNTQICDATKTRMFVPQNEWYLYGL